MRITLRLVLSIVTVVPSYWHPVQVHRRTEERTDRNAERHAAKSGKPLSLWWNRTPAAPAIVEKIGNRERLPELP
jgi:hypothetical protein